MNHIHRIIWSEAQQAWVVTHEQARSRGKRSTRSAQPAALALAGALACAAAAATPPAPTALPSGAQVVAGQATVATQGSAMTVNQGSERAILNWQRFDIGADASVRFVQPGASSVALNRVLGQDPSAIFGRLSANGQVFLVNPNGVLFGRGARVDVGGLVASTLDIGNDDFLGGRWRFQRQGAGGSVVNQGELLAGLVALLAPEVRNEGVIAAPMGRVALAAGEAVTLNLTGQQGLSVQVDPATVATLVENRHLIQVEGGTALLSAQSAQALLGQVVNSGSIDATGISTDGGTVRLLASGSVAHSGSLRVDGGATGQGGSAILLASLGTPGSRTVVSGEISARGGLLAGDGGFIETSGDRVSIADGARIGTRAPQGRNGLWLIDPVSFTVAAQGGDITGATLSTQLAGTDVALAAQCANPVLCNPNAAVVDGDIFINDSVSWAGASTLTLNAGRDIHLNAPVSVDGGTLSLKFGQAGRSTDMLPAPGTYHVRAPVHLSSSSGFRTQYLADGLPVNHTVITSAAGLQAMALDGRYVLGASLTLSGEWTPIGNNTSAFDGSFDGLGHTITGLTVSGTGANTTHVGLFGVLRPTVDLFTFEGTPALVQNVGLIDARVAGLAHVGALVGRNEGSILNSHARSTGVDTSVVTGRDEAGVGFAPGSNDDVVTAIGGLVGSNVGLISGSYADVTVRALSGDQGLSPHGFSGGIGGLVGVHTSGAINGSYAAGAVSGVRDVGGFAGYAASTMVANFSRGAVNGNTDVGGFLGYFDNPASLPGLLAANFWDTTRSGQTGSAGQLADEVTGLSSTQMRVANNFINATADNQATRAPAWNQLGWELRDGQQPLRAQMLLPLFVTADSSTRVYTGLAASGFGHTVNAGGATAGVDYTGSVSVSASGGATSVGRYTLTPSGLTLSQPDNPHGYRLVYVEGNLDITRAPLTVTADNASRLYGATNPTLGATLSGFVNGETLATAGITGSAAVSTAATAGTGVGQVAITAAQGTLAASNYSFTSFTPGTLTITPAPLTVTADNTSRTYGAANPTLGATLSGFVNGETVATAGVTGSAAVSTAATAGTGVGQVAITAAQGTLAASNYSFTSFTPGTLTITPAPLTVTADNTSRTYGAANPTLGATFSGFVNGETLATAGVTGSASVSTAATAGTGVGQVAITAAQGTLAASNYSFASFTPGTLTITPAPLTVTADNTSRTYGAANPTLGATVSGFVNGETLATAGVTGSAAVSTAATAGTGVGQVAITAAQGTLAASNYSFASFTPGTLTITPAPLTVTASNASRLYGAANPTLSATLSGFVNGETLATAGITGSAAVSTNATAGTGVGQVAITAAQGTLAASNYSFTSFTPGTLTITPAPLTVTASNASRTYGAANPTLGATLSGFVNGETLTTAGITGSAAVSTAATAGTGVGQVAITAAQGTLAASNYSFASFTTGTLTITPAPLTVTADNASRLYGATNPTLGATLSGFVNGETLATAGISGSAAVSTSATTGTGVGQATITAAQGTLSASNYSFTSFTPGTLTITPAPLTVTASNASRTYGAANPTLGATLSGFVNGETLATAGVTGSAAVSTAATAGTGVGQVAITAAKGTLAASNYSFTSFTPGTLTITPAPLTVTADNTSRTYGAANPTLGATLSGFVNGETLATAGITGSAALSTTATALTDVGQTSINIAVGTLTASNYSFTRFTPGTLSITPAPLTVTASDASRTYGAANPALAASFSGFVNGQTLATSGITGSAALATAATALSNAGQLPISAAQGSLQAQNYAFTDFRAGTLTITPAPLTLAADAQTRLYGAANPGLTATLSGFVNGQTAVTAGVTGSAALSTTATPGTDVGTVPITVAAGTLSAPNYTIASTTPGTLSITPAPLTVSADAQTRRYGASNPTLTATVSGFVNGQTLASAGVTGSAALATTATAATGVGEVPITVAQGTLAARNYSFAGFSPGSLRITPAPLTVTANDASMVAGGVVPALGTTVSGFVNGETLATSGVTGAGSATAAASAASPVGTVPIVAGIGTLAAGNYSFTTLVDGRLSIVAGSASGPNPQLQNAIETIQRSLQRYGITQDNEVDTTKFKAGSAAQAEAQKVALGLQQARSTGGADTQFRENLRQLVAQECGSSCSVSSADVDAYLHNSHKDNQRRLAAQAQQAAERAAAVTAAQTDKAMEAAAAAKRAADAARADPGSATKAAASAAAAQAAADAKAAADKASATQMAAEAASAQARAETAASETKPKDRSAQIEKALGAARLEAQAMVALVRGFGKLFGTLVTNGSTPQPEQPEAPSPTPAEFEQAKAELDAMDPATRDATRKLVSQRLMAESQAEQQAQAEQAAQTATTVAQAAAAKAAASKRAAEQAAATAAADPGSADKADAAREAAQQATIDSFAARKAAVAATTAVATAADKTTEAGKAASAAKLGEVQFTAFLSEREREAAEKDAVAKAGNVIVTAVNVGLTAVFSNLTQLNAAAAPAKAAAEAQAIVEEVAQKQAASAAATRKAEAAERELARADNVAARAVANVEGERDAPEKAGILAQMRTLQREAERMYVALHQTNVDGVRDGNANGWPIKILRFNEQIQGLLWGSSMGTDLATLQRSLEQMKATMAASIGEMSGHGLPPEGEENLRTARMAADPNKLATVNADAMAGYARDSAKRAETDRVKAQTAQAEAEKAQAAAVEARAEADRLAALSKDATDGRAAAVQAAQQRAADAEKAAAAMSAAARQAVTAAAQAAADNEVAKQVAEKAAVDTAAARIAVRQAEAEKAAHDQRLYEAALAKVQAAVTERAAWAEETATIAKEARATFTQAKVDQRQWEKTAVAKAAEVSTTAAQAATDLAAFRDSEKALAISRTQTNMALAEANKAVAAANALNEARSEARAAFLEAADAAGSSAQDGITLLSNLIKGDTPISLIRKMNEARDKLDQAEAEWRAARDVVRAKEATFNAAQAAENRQVDATNAAAAKANLSAQASAQAQADKAVADHNAKAYAKFADKALEYSRATENDARLAADASAADKRA